MHTCIKVIIFNVTESKLENNKIKKVITIYKTRSDLHYRLKVFGHPLDFEGSPKNWSLHVFFKPNLLAQFKPEGLSLPEGFYV